MILYCPDLKADAQADDMFSNPRTGIQALPSERSQPLFSPPPAPMEQDKDMLPAVKTLPRNTSQDMVNPTIRGIPPDRLYNWPQSSAGRP